jgi:hypothetical protein
MRNYENTEAANKCPVNSLDNLYEAEPLNHLRIYTD